ncbi:unnamed protein product [Trichobilharzia regenti]|nr:unnamed protein product [Trichobilharzia regenti]
MLKSLKIILEKRGKIYILKLMLKVSTQFVCVCIYLSISLFLLLYNWRKKSCSFFQELVCGDLIGWLQQDFITN